MKSTINFDIKDKEKYDRFLKVKENQIEN